MAFKTRGVRGLRTDDGARAPLMMSQFTRFVEHLVCLGVVALLVLGSTVARLGFMGMVPSTAKVHALLTTPIWTLAFGL